MVKKKGKSKRTTLKDKYKIQRRTVETNRKRRKEAKRDAKAGIVKHPRGTSRDPGIPNSWPFKQDLLKEIQRARERQQEQQQRKRAEMRERRKSDQQATSSTTTTTNKTMTMTTTTTTTVQDLMKKAGQDLVDFQSKTDFINGGVSSRGNYGGGRRLDEDNDDDNETRRRDDGCVVSVGQASRRAYLRELKKVIDSSDVVLQILDARDPLGSRIHPSVENAILSRADKRMVLVLNKIDLVPKTVVSQWLSFLRRSHPTIAIKASRGGAVQGSSDGNAAGIEDATCPVGMEGLLQLLKNYARTGAGGGGGAGGDKKAKTTIVVGIVGYPNTGKSSLVNALKRTRAVGVSPKPGFTTSMQEVVLDRNVRLLDSPGVVFDDRNAMLGNCLHADTLDDPIPAVAEILARCDPASLIMTYNIPAFPPGDVAIFLSMVAKSYGRVRKGGIPDKAAAARAVLRDWNTGKIPYYTSPPKNAPAEKSNYSSSSSNVEAIVGQGPIVVTKFAEEFDISKLDEDLMKTLKDTDEMDYVQVHAKERGGNDDDDDDERRHWHHRQFKFLTKDDEGDDDDDDDDGDKMSSGENDHDDDDEAMEQDSDSEHENVPTRSQLANADDYVFEEM